MERRLGMALAALVAALALSGGVAGTAQADAPSLTGRVLVSLRPVATPGAALAAGFSARATAASGFRAAAARLADAGHAHIAGPVVAQIGLVTLTPSGGESVAGLIASLRSDPGVVSTSAEFRFAPRFVPNDPALTLLEGTGGPPPGTVVQWWAARERLFGAWDISRGDGAQVAVIDSGVDGGHPELSGKLRGAYSWDGIPGHGGPLVDESGHGTHVASMACAASNNGIGLAGAGLNCGLIIEKTDFGVAGVSQAIVDAVDRGADAINLSFGADSSQPPPQALVDAIDYAVSRNVVLVAAAADTATAEQGLPARLLQPSGTAADLGQGKGLVVTAANFADQRSSHAGFGSQISLAAYGDFADASGPPGLLGAFPRQSTTIDTGGSGPNASPCGCRQTLPNDPGTYAYLSGTSFAAPAVSAIAALAHHLNPDLRVQELLALMRQSARRPAHSGWASDLGWGILDARAALDRARRIDHRAPLSRVHAPAHAHGPAITLRLSGSDPAPRGLIASGIAFFDVYRSVDRGRAVRIARTRRTRLRTRVRAGHRYRFFSIATDRAGNRESRQPVPARVATG